LNGTDPKNPPSPSDGRSVIDSTVDLPPIEVPDIVDSSVPTGPDTTAGSRPRHERGDAAAG
jgi:hypothetical protein